MRKIVWVIVMTCCGICGNAQTINNTYTYRDMPGHNYVRLLYENDYFTATDKFYTQGINLEVGAYGLRKLPTSRLLIKPGNDSMQYRFALQHNAYTPESIRDTNIRFGDRPYASSFMMQFQSVATNYEKRHRITTVLSLGVMGRIAGGEWMQKSIHKATDNTPPQGWHHQIANDVVINYRLQYEKNILQLGKILSLNANASADAGTLLDKISAGGSILLGYFNSPYDENKNRLSIYLYTHPQVHAIGYDAMLQGGLFISSPYTIPASKINRVVLDNRYGIIIKLGRVYFEYFRYNTGKEFSGGFLHSWGGVQAGVSF